MTSQPDRISAVTTLSHTLSSHLTCWWARDWSASDQCQSNIHPLFTHQLRDIGQVDPGCPIITRVRSGRQFSSGDMPLVEDFMKMQRKVAGSQTLFHGDVAVVNSEESIDHHVKAGLLEGFPHGTGLCSLAELDAASRKSPLRDWSLDPANKENTVFLNHDHI